MPLTTDTAQSLLGDIVTDTIDRASAWAIRWMRRLMLIGLGLAALQPLSAGFFLSGYCRAVTIHAGVVLVLLVPRQVSKPDTPWDARGAWL
jgi:hypothetical protein